MKLIGYLLAGLIVLASLEAIAQDSGDGLMNSVAYRQLPAGEAITVRALDNSDDNMVVLQEFEDALRQRGYTVSPEANFILSFETRDEIGAWTDDGRRTFVELSARGGDEGGEDAKARFNLYNSSKGGILNKGQRSGTSIMTPSQYRLDATIEDRRNGKRLWQAWTVADLGAYNGLTLTKMMVPIMVNNLGQTVKRQPFNLR